MNSLRMRIAILASALPCLGASESRAQAYPAKPIRLVVPFAAGGGADVLARTIAPAVGERLGQQMVIDNRAGAAGTIGSAQVARASPDGYTLLLVTVPFLISANLFDKLPYDPLKDFAPVTLLVTTPNILAVHPSLPVKSVKDLIALARAYPGRINYAAPVGTVIQLSAELFKTMAKADLTHITYAGTAPAVIAVLSGESSVVFGPTISVLPHSATGRLRAVAITSSQRSPALPELPTIAESGLPGFDMVTWYGVLAPAATPEDIITRLNLELVKIITSPEVAARFIRESSVPGGSTPAEFGAYLKNEMGKIGKLVKTSGARTN